MKTMPWPIKKNPKDAPPLPPAPARDQQESVLPAETETTGWFTPTRIGVLVASVPSVLSLILMVAVVAEMTSTTDDFTPSGLATGVFFDAIVAGLVAIAWFQPTVRKQAGYGAWVGAVAAAALIAWHYQGSVQMAFALIPLLAKFTWHLTLVARTAADKRAAEAARVAAEKARRQEEEAERRERELSTDLTPEQEEELAQIRRGAVYARAKAEVESELTTAEAEADRQRQQAAAESERIRQETESQMRREAVRRQVAEQMEVQQANADLLQQRAELETRLRLTRPYQLGGAEEPPSRVPDDPSGFGIPPVGGDAGAPVAGFGAGLSEARSGGGGIGRHPGGIAPDLAGRPSPTVGGGGNGHQGGDIAADQAERAPHHAARVAAGQDTRQRVLEEIRYAGVQVSNAELSRLLRIGRTTVRDHRNALRDAGHRVYPDSE